MTLKSITINESKGLTTAVFEEPVCQPIYKAIFVDKDTEPTKGHRIGDQYDFKKTVKYAKTSEGDTFDKYLGVASILAPCYFDRSKSQLIREANELNMTYEQYALILVGNYYCGVENFKKFVDDNAKVVIKQPKPVPFD